MAIVCVMAKFASKLTEKAVILRYNFSLSDCHFSLIFPEGTSLLSGPSLNPWTSTKFVHIMPLNLKLPIPYLRSEGLNFYLIYYSHHRYFIHAGILDTVVTCGI